MAQEEKTGERDLTYSCWHRAKSTSRFVDDAQAKGLGMIDIDVPLYVEYQDGTKEPIAIFETARDIGQDYKCATVTKRLAERAGLIAAIVLYKPSQTPNPANPSLPDIESFRVLPLLKKGGIPVERSEWLVYSPEEWAKQLCKIRTL